MSAKHPWLLTGPWYRWRPDTGIGDPVGQVVPDAGRRSRPEIQKYATTDFAQTFLEEPQRYLKPGDEDFWKRTILANGQEPTPQTPGDAQPPSADPLGTYFREQTQIRKLFKSTHGRHYMVVFELHCDATGLPNVPEDEVEEAGFVVRRLRVDVESGAQQEATEALQQIALAEQQLANFDRNGQGRIRAAAGLIMERQLNRIETKHRNQLLEDWGAGHLKLDELAAARAFDLQTEGWFPDADHPLMGEWRTLTDATPHDELGGEGGFIMYKLTPDPANTTHTAVGRTVYFGTVPTGAREFDGTQAPRFDDQHIYEIRCWVRRKHDKPGCKGELVWSEPTIGYKIASDWDPEGTANLPVSATVPSFRDLQAFADSIGTGGAGGLRLVQPPDSVMPLDGNYPEAGAGQKTGFGQICFFAFIIFFLIALFLAFLFLPIIVFLFQLFFLLRLKFCIPPSIDFDIDLAIELKASLDVQFEAGIDADFGVGLETDLLLLQQNPDFQADLGVPADGLAGIEAFVDAQIYATYGGTELNPTPMSEELVKLPLATKLQRVLDLRADFRGNLDPELLAEMGFDQWSDPVAEPGSNNMTPVLPAGPPLVYYEIKELPT